MDELITLKDETEACRLCNLKKIDDFRLGPLFQRDGFVAHYYCVLFSDELPQRGEDGEGIMGFLVKDVKAEVERVKTSLCFYCKKPNASIHCASKKCKIGFHFPCGIAKGSLHQFQRGFKSYCIKHRPIQEIPEKVIKDAEVHQIPCAICYDSVDYRSKTDTIWANCCCTTWYHRDCLQKHALSSGYFFKCAICNNNRKFKKWVEKYGIYVPKKDASWELEPNAFGELTRQYSQCDAEDCKCPDGRDCEIVDTMWEIILCRSCGSQGIHIMCGQLKFHKPLWQCEMCKEVISKFLSERKRWSFKRIREGLGHSGQDISKVQSERHSDEDCSTSSGKERISSGSDENIKQVKKRGHKRKRADSDDGEKSVKRRYKRRRPFGSRPVRRHGTVKVGSPETAKLNGDLDALQIKLMGNENNSNEAVAVEESPRRESNSAEDQDSDDGFTLEEIKRRREIEERGLHAVGLKDIPPTTEEEKAYRSCGDGTRRENDILVISVDEGNDSEVEVILDEKDSPEETGESRRSCIAERISCSALQGSKSGNILTRKNSEESAAGECGVKSGEAGIEICETRAETTKARKGEVTLTLKKRLARGGRSCVSSDSDHSDGSLDRSLALKALKHFQARIQKLIETQSVELERSKSNYTRRKLRDKNGKSPEPSTSGEESGSDDNDIQVIEVVRSNGGSQQPAVGRGEEDIIEIE